MIQEQPKLYICIPVLNESENIPQLLYDIRRQTYPCFKIIICVNQPEEWWNNPEKEQICLNNRATLELLKQETGLPLQIIDKSSPGNGWIGKKHGVGWARKVAMDVAEQQAGVNDIILSLDADTSFAPEYFEAVVKRMQESPKAIALSVPYIHPLSGVEELDRLMLRYEIYMRHYVLSLWEIENPFAFTAIGSAMAVPAWAYSKVGGISSVLSGEDFYFMLKLSKSGEIIHTCNEKVYPQGRLSNRVYFGTGPALIKGSSGNWNSYPIYPQHLFQKVKESFKAFKTLWEADIPFPMKQFLAEQFKSEQWWYPIRTNYKTKEQFMKACTIKCDALRILQYLKAEHTKNPTSDEQELIKYIEAHYTPEFIREQFHGLQGLNFSTSPIILLENIRQQLLSSEHEYRKKHDERLRAGK